MADVVLGIETSCDETSAALVADGQEILSNVIATQLDLGSRAGVPGGAPGARQPRDSLTGHSQGFWRCSSRVG